MDFVYLDHNATAPVHPEARRAVEQALAIAGNASSIHRSGRQVRRLVEDARLDVAQLVCAKSAEVVFTSGGTEANNLAIRGTPAASLVVGAIEHDSILAPARSDGRPLSLVPARRSGVVDLDSLGSAIAAAPRPALVSLMLANNETGVIQPLAEAIALARAHGAWVHTDAIQAAGRIAVDFAGLGVDLMSVSAHKIGGPQGVGALLVREGFDIRAQILGGGQEGRRRAGTENVPGISGFGAAAAAAGASLMRMSEVGALRDAMEQRLRVGFPAVEIFGQDAPRLPNTTCLALGDLSAEILVMALDLAGIGVSAGAACSSGKVQPSHVLCAMGLGATVASRAIRVSLGVETTGAGIDRLLAALAEIAGRHDAVAMRARPAR